MSIGDREQRQFLAFHELFDDDDPAGQAESTFSQHGANRAARIRASRAHHGTLATRETRGFHHQRFGVTVHVLKRLVQAIERPARRGGDARLLHHFLREGLRCFDSRPGSSGSEHRTTLGPQPVGESQRQGLLGSYDGEINAVGVRCIGEAIDVGGGDFEIGGDFRGAGIPRRTIDVGGGKVVTKRPAQRVFPSSTSDDQYSHFSCAFRKASPTRFAAFLAASTT